MKSFKLVTALIFAGFLLASLSFHVAAQQRGQVVIDPAFQEVVVASGQDSQQFYVRLTNNSGTTQTFQLTVVDFGSLNETGGVAFIGLNAPQRDNKYGLSPWIELDRDTITVSPGKTEQMNARLINEDSLSPGGHYGAILVKPQKSAASPDRSKVELSQVISSLIFAKKIGGDIYKLELKSAGDNGSSISLAGKVNLRFYNSGNVHLVPRGSVTITDRSGKVIKEGLINAESGYILPESHRQYIAAMKNISAGWWPGQYNINVNYRFDGKDSFETQTAKFFYVGKAPKLAIIGFLLAVFAWLLLKKFKLSKFLRTSFKRRR